MLFLRNFVLSRSAALAQALLLFPWHVPLHLSKWQVFLQPSLLSIHHQFCFLVLPGNLTRPNWHLWPSSREQSSQAPPLRLVFPELSPACGCSPWHGDSSLEESHSLFYPCCPASQGEFLELFHSSLVPLNFALNPSFFPLHLWLLSL